MPDFEVTDPDGKKYRVSGPEGSTAEQALAQVQAQVGQPDQMADIGKGAISGAARAVTGTIGLPGDLGSLVGAAAGRIGISPETRATVARAVKGLPVVGALAGPNSADVQKMVEGVTGKFPEPQTTGGKFVEKLGEFAPAIIGGPESLATKILTRTAAPAAAMTAAEQVTDNPYAQMGAAIGASALAHRAVTRAAPGLAAKDLYAAARQNYQDVHNLGLELRPQGLEALATRIENNLANDGLTARNAAPVFDALGTLRNPPAGVVGTSHTFDNLRKEMVQATQSADGSVRTAAGRTIRQLDDYLANIPPSDVLRGNARQASQLFGEARGNYAAARRAEMVQGRLEAADLNAATANSGANIDNATRQAIKQLITPDKYGRLPAVRAGFNADEIAQMQRIARGTSLGNLTRIAGNALGGGLGIGGLAAGAFGQHEFGEPGLALPLLGRGLRGLGNRMTTNAGARLAAQVAARSPAAMLARNPGPAGLSAIQTGLLAGLFAQPR